MTVPTMTVTIDGTPMPLATPVSVADVLAPEVDTAEISVPWGSRAISGSEPPVETLPALGSDVLITSSTGYEWRGTLTARTRSAAGKRRQLTLSARGPALDLDKAYLPSFARAGFSGVVQAPGGPRFAPGTRSASAGGPGGTFYLGGTGDWTIGQALEAYLAHASYAGLPAITLDAGSTSLTRVLGDIDTDGGSYHAALAQIIGHRNGLVWRCQRTAGGRVLRVRGLSGSGQSINLAAANVTGYSVSEDLSAALSGLEVRGARTVYVVSIDGKTTGDLIADWTGSDETARAAGDRSSPAYRRFRLAVFTLPDGSPSVTADFWPDLPIADSTVLSRGSSPWLAFAQRSSDSLWESLQGRVSISAGGGRIYIEGIDPAEWDGWSRIRLTLALAPRAHLVATRSGGSGSVRGLAVVGGEHIVASSAAVRISGGSLATVSGTARSDSDPVTDQADSLWATLSGPQMLAEWTVDGVCGGGPDPGQRVTELLLPVPGAPPTAVACDAICATRRIAWFDRRPRTTWTIAPRPFSTAAVIR
jgi:hypothetical protein